jgi:hypothetical protein
MKIATGAQKRMLDDCDVLEKLLKAVKKDHRSSAAGLGTDAGSAALARIRDVIEQAETVRGGGKKPSDEEE